MYTKVDKFRPILFLFFYFTAASFAFFAEASDITLSMYNANWNSIFGGEAIAPPKETSNGFMVLTDGKTLSSCSETGMVRWEKELQSRSTPLFSVFPDDFIAVVSDEKTVSLLNLSGITLWTKEVDFAITEEPKQGRDGRIFVRGEKNIACFGINGICKWSIQTDALKSIPLVELNDGSLFLVLENNSNSEENVKSSALIVSPFGKKMRVLDFSETIYTAFSCEQGVVLGFTNGEFALFSVIAQSVKKVWSVPLEKIGLKEEKQLKGMTLFPLQNTLSAIILQGVSFPTTVVIFENSAGNIKSTFQSTIPLAELLCYSRAMAGNALFLCNRSVAKILDFSGKILWSAKLPPLESKKTAWNYVAYTKKDFLLLCSKSWMISAYRTVQANTKNLQNQRGKNPYPSYENFYDDISASYVGLFSESLMAEITDSTREKILENGFYAEKEKDFSSTIFSALNAYKTLVSSEVSRSPKKNSLVHDKEGFRCILNQGCLLGTKKMSDLLSEILSYQNDYDILLLLTRAAGKTGYDPNEKMFSALEASLLKIPMQNSQNIIAISDAIYEICQFMGKKELYPRCVKLFSSLISNKYDKSVNESARKNLLKLAKG